MKDILDVIILVMFVIMVALFIINFNRQQIDKYKNKIEPKETNEKDKNNSPKENIDE